MPFLFSLISSILFALVTPVSKIILTDINPIFMAGLSYFSSAICVGVYRLIVKNKEEGILKKDIFALIGIIVFGGILAPVFLFKAIAIVARLWFPFF
ncbi:MAG: EamA family transporter [Elusimicrobiota bacterium]